MVRTPLDDLDPNMSFGSVEPNDTQSKPAQPPDTTGECALCHKPLKVRFHWVYSRWWRNTAHDKCAEAYDKNTLSSSVKPSDQEIPARFAQFNPEKVDKAARLAAAEFSPASQYKTLAIIGVPARAKSRLMWATVQAFFSELERTTGLRRWVDYYLFSDLAFEPDRNILARVKIGKFVFIDDVGATDSFGRDRAQLQDIIRARVQKGQWTFLTIDNLDFDSGFEDLFRDRAVTIRIQQ